MYVIGCPLALREPIKREITMAFRSLSSWGDFSYGASREERLDELAAPILVETFAYWKKVTPKGAIGPAWGVFRLQDLSPEAISLTLVVDVLRDPLDFRYRFWGTAHVERKKIDRTGQRTSDEHPQGRGPKVAGEYQTVVERHTPLLFSRLIEFPDGRLPLPQLALRLPLSNDGEQVTGIASVTYWDEKRLISGNNR